LSKASNDHGGQSDKNGLRKIFSRIEILAPREVCTESYLVVGSYDHELHAKNMHFFLRTKFCRYLVSIMLLTHNISRGSFKYVPSLPMEIEWTDNKLNEFFDLTDDEVAFINDNIKSMD
jgi:site-specific DNA-methyltransferase (adenine-specific)